MIYLDAAATIPLRRDVLEKMWPHFGPEFGNPSSHHELGESAAAALTSARAQVADIFGCRASEVTFTSGGTESDNAAIKGIALGDPRGKHLITSAVEHPAVLESAGFLSRMGFDVSILDVDGVGIVDPGDLERALRPDTTLVSIQYANNEVGTIQPIADLARVAGDIAFHTDAVQAAGWLDLNVGRLGVRALSISGHKFGGPKGIGVLYVNRRQRIEPLIHGGGQEGGRRSGTENVAGAVGLAAALALVSRDNDATIAMRDDFIANVLHAAPQAALTGHSSKRLPGTASFVFPGTSGEAILLELAARGIVCSSGSACAAGSDEPSHVLTAMGIPGPTAQTAVRFTFGREVTAEGLSTTAEELREAVARVSGLGC